MQSVYRSPAPNTITISTQVERLSNIDKLSRPEKIDFQEVPNSNGRMSTSRLSTSKASGSNNNNNETRQSDYQKWISDI